jgi:outer membrane lipoprotein-sorting protein
VRKPSRLVPVSTWLGSLALFTLQARAVAPLEAPSWSDVVARYATVHDYTCLYEKQERAIDHGAVQTIRMSFRKPLDVRLEWLDDTGKVDQVAVYRQGNNDGKVIVKRRGLVGSIAGTLRLDPHGTLALQDSRHPITQVGLGHIIDRVSQDLRNERVISQPPVEETIDGRACDRLQLDAPEGTALFGIEGARGAVVWIDRVLQLPTKIEILDSARDMIERHRFRDVRLNPGLADAVFTL